MPEHIISKAEEALWWTTFNAALTVGVGMPGVLTDMQLTEGETFLRRMCGFIATRVHGFTPDSYNDGVTPLSM